MSRVENRMHPLTGELLGGSKPSKANRPEIFQLNPTPAKRHAAIKATYDAARDSDEFKNYWVNADALDADSANSRAVRQKLVTRSRYEVGSNGYTDGIVQTHANYLVGIGPSLRMESGTEGFNRAVEFAWRTWTKATLFRRKLWALAHAKVQDGEGIAVVRNNPRVNHPVQLDLIPIETEQCQTPMLPYSVDGYIDGIRFDEFGNPEWYDILKYHPGGQVTHNMASVYGEPERVPSRFIVHWFKLRRPGQHRGVPELKSTLNVGASSRRWREATVAAAETAADISVLLKTSFTPNEVDEVAPMSTIEFNKRMMTALPAGWEGGQMKAEHPNATYESFHTAQINEQARPLNMPLNIAKSDSSGYNYASGRLDHQTYFSAIDVDREDANDLVLDKLFSLWWYEAVYAYGWNANPDSPPPHSWNWPEHPVADRVSEAQANDIELKNGSTDLPQIHADKGGDFNDSIVRMAESYGVDETRMREALFFSILNAQNQQAGMMQAQNQANSQGANANG